MPVVSFHICFDLGALSVLYPAKSGYSFFHRIGKPQSDQFRDNLMFFAASPDMTLPNILRELNTYWELSILNQLL